MYRYGLEKQVLVQGIVAPVTEFAIMAASAIKWIVAPVTEFAFPNSLLRPVKSVLVDACVRALVQLDAPTCPR